MVDNPLTPFSLGCRVLSFIANTTKSPTTTTTAGRMQAEKHRSGAQELRGIVALGRLA